MDAFFSSLLLFGGAVIWTWIVLAAFVIICLIADIGKNGFWATFAFGVLCAVYYFFGQYKPLLELFSWSWVAGYLIIGLVYSVVRTYVEGVKLGNRVSDMPTLEEYKISQKNAYISEHNSDTREGAIYGYKQELKNNVARWWFLWWISMITWVLGDLLRDVWKVVYAWMKNFYDHILDLGINTVLKKFTTPKA
jgi:hypothetical protein